MTRDEQIIKAALDMVAQWLIDAGIAGDGLDDPLASAIRAIPVADVLAKVGVTNTNLEPPRLMAMCGHCRSAGEEYCVQYLKDLRWDGAEWCCKDCFDGSGENGDWDEATQPCPQPAPDAVTRLVEAANHARLALAGYVSTQSAIDKLDETLAAMETNHDQ